MKIVSFCNVSVHTVLTLFSFWIFPWEGTVTIYNHVNASLLQPIYGTYSGACNTIAGRQSLKVWSLFTILKNLSPR